MATRQIILVGKTGNGKSSTGNSILEKDVFQNEDGSSAVTQVCQKEEVIRTDVQRKYVVVDTPGLFDTNIQFGKRAMEIQKAATEYCQKPHAFLIIMKGKARYTLEEKHTINMLRITFGNKFLDHAILVFTKGKKFKSREDLDDYIQKNEALMELKHACGDRVAIVENKTKAYARIRVDLLQSLFDMIERMCNGGQRYYNNKYLPIHRECLKSYVKKDHDETTLEEMLKDLIRSIDTELERKRFQSELLTGLQVLGGYTMAAVGPTVAIVGAAAASPVAVAVGVVAGVVGVGRVAAESVKNKLD